MGESLEIVIRKAVNIQSLARKISILSDLIEEFPKDSLAKKFLDACQMIISIATLSSYKDNFEKIINLVNEGSKPSYYYSFVQQVYCFVEKVASLIGFNQELLNEMKKYKDISKVDFNKVDVKEIYSLADNVANEIDRIVEGFSVNSIIDKLENLFNGKKGISETYSAGGRSYIVEAYKDDVGIHLSVSFT